jgi:lipopolysaccharide transport system ATP-binding protein
VISVQNVSKRFSLYQRPIERILGVLPFKAQRPPEFWALKEVSFRVEKGEVLAILGPNGSGKSTLLQIISGILQPTTGRALCNGRVSALLELGAGFNPEFTGRENVYLNGEIMGIGRKEMVRIFPKIEAFAEIGEFIDRPVKEYSTGMYVRLAFSAAIHVEPEVLIVDEALSVGDAIFATRCIRKFEELRHNQTTVLLVSHDLGLVKRLADRAVFMLHGKVEAAGSAKDAVNRYVGFVLDSDREQGGNENRQVTGTGAQTTFRHGDRATTITDVQLLDSAGNARESFERGQTLVIRLTAVCNTTVNDPVVGILIRNRIGMDVYGTNTRLEQIRLGQFEPGESLEVEFQLDCLLTRQEYTLTVATQYQDGLSQDWLDDVLSFRVIDTKDLAGVLNLNARITHRRPS